MMWQLRCALGVPHLLVLSATAFALPSVPRPLQGAFHVQSGWDEGLGWDLPPSPNSTHHLIFNSVSGLLHRWTNTLRSRRNGHSLVPAIVPKGTILYHGRGDPQIPSSPDWLAFDFEHAYLFCRRPDSSHVISLQVKRDLRLVYFDGSSAAKMKSGTMDSQDVILWGRPQPDKYSSEGERIKALCDWGRPFGLDGFVRMEYHFEAMLCDFFSDAMEVVTSLNVIPRNQSIMDLPGVPIPLPPIPSKPPPGWLGSLPNDYRVYSEAYFSGSWHDHAPGETRVHLDYAGFVTFYDTSLTSLVEARHGKDRAHIRLEGISVPDSESIRAELQKVLTRESRGGGSGIDWGSITRVVMERYSTRLEYLRFLLSTTFVDELERAAAARAQLLVIIAPYIATVDVPSANPSWAAPIAQRCALTQTSHISLGMLTPQEARIHAAVENTLHEICRRLVLVWVELVDVEAADELQAAEATGVAREHIEELMSWLDWSVWVRCEPACSLGEMCYLPSWPFRLGGDEYDTMPYCVSLSNVIPL